MTCPTPDHIDHTTPVPPPLAATSTAARVEAALTALDRAFLTLERCPNGDDRGWAAYSTAMALICARRAGWWRVLLVEDARTRALHPLHLRAAQIAHEKAQQDFRFWRDTAADWQARADGEPTSDTAGALCNRTELGVTT